ncbi:NmrA family NAD(P)-binding protein [Pseudonocardia sp. RS010]|uniref:NmrA family NAD(P)-binding protein n=1 Tax=Pseudonocardia sp. RS010 TaxID=3385979 RepID=UPI00399FD9C7
MIIVTGANGQLGRGVVTELLAHTSAEQIGVSVRDISKAQELSALGVSVRQGDFTDHGSLAHAFEGATQVLIISVDATGGDAVSQHATAIAAAREAGAGRILYTSHVGADPTSPFAPMRDHAATEELLKESGVPFTSLRHGFYAQNLVRLITRGIQTGTLYAPEDGPVSWTTHADLAAADAAILADDASFDGVTPPLTAPLAPTFDEVARIASETLGRTIDFNTAADEDWVTGLVEHAGMSEGQARFLLTIFTASRRGDFAAHGPALEDLIKRPAQSVREVITAHFGGL